MAITDRRGVPVDSTDTIIAGDPSPGLAIKAPVRVATTGSNIALTGLQIIDGVLLAAGDRVLVKDQTDQTTNGIYAAATGSWTRTTDAAGNAQWVNGTMVAINGGTVNLGVLLRCTSGDPIVIGTSPIIFTPAWNVTASSLTVTGSSNVPTQNFGNDTNAIASTAFVENAALGYDPTDVGYDIWVLAGQSNMVGNGHSFDPNLDTSDPRIFQYPYASAAGFPANTIDAANDPLNYGGAPEIGPPALIGPAMSFARTLIRDMPRNRSILLLPQAANGTSFSSGLWAVGANYAQCVVTCTGQGMIGDTVVINGHTVTIVSSGASGPQINFSSNATTLAQNLLTYVNANTLTLAVNGVGAGNNWIMYANTIGSAGDLIAVSRTGVSFLFGQQSSIFLGGGSDAPGGFLFVTAVAQANAAIALSTHNRIGGFLWLQGEADSTMSGTLYRSLWQASIAAYRAQVTGAATAPFVAIGMVPEWVAGFPQIQPIDIVHKQLPAQMTRTAFAPGALGSNDPLFGGPPFHYDAPTQRQNGYAAYLAYYRAKNNVLGGVASAPTNVTAAAVTIAEMTVSWSPPQGPNSRVLTWSAQWRATGSGNAWSSQSVDISLLAATIVGLNAGTSYDIQVLGVNEQGNGTPSAVVTVVTQPIIYLLDDVLSASSAAFSLRKLRSAWAGSCLRAHRALDNVEHDIGFTAATGLIDTATLLQFAAGGTVLVAKWYDQSGNGNDAAQATTADMPQIVVSGVLQTSPTGFPAINFQSGGPVFLAGTAGYPVAADVTAAAVIDQPTGSGTMAVIGSAAGGNHNFFLGHQVGYYVSGIIVTAPLSLPPGPYSIGASYVASTTTASIYQSGVFQAAASGGSPSTGAGFQIGAYLSSSDQFVGLMQQVLIFSAPLTAQQMAFIAGSDATNWGTT